MKLTKIFDANDRAKELGVKDHRTLIRALTGLQRESIKRPNPFHSEGAEQHTRQIIKAMQIEDWNGRTNDKVAPAIAYINGGRWLAECPVCGCLEYVTPNDPIFYCHSCWNADIKYFARPVVFPSNSDRKEIESALLQREMTLPQKTSGKIDNTQDAARATGSIRLDWYPGETAKKLQAENKEGK